MDMRFVAMMFACLTMGGAAIATLAGCAPTPAPTQTQACAAGVPWVPADYANGKWVPGHCLGQPAQ
jgi:hypothetical protein